MPTKNISRRFSPLFTHSKLVFIILVIIIALNFVTQYIVGQWFAYFIPHTVTTSILGLLTSWVAYYLYRSFISLKEPVERISNKINPSNWFHEQTYMVFGVHLLSVLITLFFAISGFYTYYVLGWGIYKPIPQFFYFTFVACVFGIVGSLVWAYFGLLYFAYKLTYVDFKLEIFETHSEEISEINRIYVKMFLVGVVLYIGAVFASWISPLGSYIVSFPLAQFWIFPFAGAVIVFFIAFQILIHEIIKKNKKKRLQQLAKILNERFSAWRDDPSSDNSRLIGDLLSWREKITSESEWPLNYVAVISIIGSLLLPTIKSVIDIIGK